jgi:hypothetical protein
LLEGISSREPAHQLIEYLILYELINGGRGNSNKAKYFGMTLDRKMCWKAHVKKKKREEFGLKYKKIYWLMGKISAVSIDNKLILYKY